MGVAPEMMPPVARIAADRTTKSPAGEQPASPAPTCTMKPVMRKLWKAEYIPKPLENPATFAALAASPIHYPVGYSCSVCTMGFCLKYRPRTH